MGSALLFAFTLIAAGLFGVQGAIVAVNVTLCSIIIRNSPMPPVTSLLNPV
jgi:hypothetical protein